jgi:hypothetical protein
MEDERTQEQEKKQSSQAWQDVGEQFTAFGESLAAAIQQSWQDEKTREHLRELESGLETMAAEVGKAIDETATSPDGQRVRKEFEQAARSARDATRKAWDEARPKMLSALETVDGELQRLIGDLRHPSTSEDKSDTTKAPD